MLSIFCTITKSQENADRQKEAMSTALASSDKKVLSDDSLKSISAYCDNLVYSMVDPIDAEKVVGDLQGRQDELKANLEQHGYRFDSCTRSNNG